jgi:hypothetical protein
MHFAMSDSTAFAVSSQFCEPNVQEKSLRRRGKSVFCRKMCADYPLGVSYWMSEYTSYLSPMAFLPLR